MINMNMSIIIDPEKVFHEELERIGSSLVLGGLCFIRGRTRVRSRNWLERIAVQRVRSGGPKSRARWLLAHTMRMWNSPVLAVSVCLIHLIQEGHESTSPLVVWRVLKVLAVLFVLTLEKAVPVTVICLETDVAPLVPAYAYDICKQSYIPSGF